MTLYFSGQAEKWEKSSKEEVYETFMWIFFIPVLCAILWGFVKFVIIFTRSLCPYFPLHIQQEQPDLILMTAFGIIVFTIILFFGTGKCGDKTCSVDNCS